MPINNPNHKLKLNSFLLFGKQGHQTQKNKRLADRYLLHYKRNYTSHNSYFPYIYYKQHMLVQKGDLLDLVLPSHLVLLEVLEVLDLLLDLVLPPDLVLPVGHRPLGILVLLEHLELLVHLHHLVLLEHLVNLVHHHHLVLLVVLLVLSDHLVLWDLLVLWDRLHLLHLWLLLVLPDL